MLSTAMPAVLRSGSRGRSTAMPRDRADASRPARATRRAVTRSPIAWKLWPSTSKPTATLPTLAGANAVAALPHAHSCAPEVGADAQQVGEHAAGGHFGAGARALHDQRILVVAPREEAHDVVGELDVRERVRALQLDQADRRVAGRRVERADVAQHLDRGCAPPSGAPPSARRTRAGVRGTPRGAQLASAGGTRLSSFTSPSSSRSPISRPRMISLRATSSARQIVARIGLGVALRLGRAHDRRERLAAVPDVEQVRERAGEDALDALDLVAGVAQVAQRLDHRQAGADGRLVQVVRAALRAAPRAGARRTPGPRCSPSCSA